MDSSGFEINDVVAIYVAISATILSLISIFISYWAMRGAKTQALFNGFQQANQAIIDHPNLLKDVHGLNVEENEYLRIAYLSILMDSFQHEGRSHKKSTFLDKITSIPENKERWEVMKTIYYGDFDAFFVNKIDAKFESNCQVLGEENETSA